VIAAQVQLMIQLLLQRVEEQSATATRPGRRRGKNRDVVEVFIGPHGQPFSAEITKAIESISAQLDGRLKIGEVAASAGLSVSHLYHRFARETNTTPREYHLNLRLQAAREALLQPESTMSMVADLFGFSSGQHFSAAFTKSVGIAPGKWRAQHRRGK
jgi:transcriptional regulator GlxA family with amidase domain